MRRSSYACSTKEKENFIVLIAPLHFHSMCDVSYFTESFHRYFTFLILSSKQTTNNQTKSFFFVHQLGQQNVKFWRQNTFFLLIKHDHTCLTEIITNIIELKSSNFFKYRRFRFYLSICNMTYLFYAVPV
jgi:hypothetical protein